MSSNTYNLNDGGTPDDTHESPALRLFTDRDEEIALFRLLRERCSPERACPIVNFIAPAGSGKRTLIDYLRKKECGQPSIPQICVDFSHTNAPKDDLLPILVKIRNKLRERTDENNRHLKFPRFDFAAPLVLARLEKGENTYQGLNNNELEDVLKEEEPKLDEWVESARDLGNIVPLAPLIAVAASQVTRIEPLNKFRRWLEEKHIWDWYKDEERSRLLGLPPEPEIRQIIRCIFEKSEPDQNERRIIVEQILPEALLADLRESFADSSDARVWPNARFAALFFYGFDALLGDAADVGIRLLKVLTLTERDTYKERNPLLLVVASQRPIIANHEREVGQTAMCMGSLADAAHAIYTTWYNEFTSHPANLDLKHLILPFVLYDFDRGNTLDFLRHFGRYYDTTTFENDPGLCDNIYEATKGHPFFLSLVATAINRTWPNAREGQVDIDLKNLIVENLTVDGKNVAASMLRVFLDQLSGLDRRELIWIAFPREIDKSILKHALQLSDEVEANEIWDNYRQLPFVRRHHQRLVLHPLARDLLLQKLPPTPENQNYYRIHERLRQYFRELYTLHPDNEEAKVEEAYHALAAGDAQPAIDLGCSVYRQKHTLWRQLMDAVAQAPVGSAKARSGVFEQQAEQALSSARRSDSQQGKLRDSITAIVLYRWILTTPMPNKQDMARLWDRLGSAYTCLPDGDVQDASFAKDKAIQIKDQIIRTQEEGSRPSPPPSPDPLIEPISPAQPPSTVILPPLPPVSAPRTRLQDKLHRILSSLHKILETGWRRGRVLLLLVLFAIAVTVAIGPLADYLSHRQPPPTNLVSLEPALYPPDGRGIGETSVAIGSEEVGVSDGSVVFDINSRTDAADKIQAAQEFRKGHGDGAEQLWSEALKQEPDDAEAQIYLENQRIAGQCVYFVVATNLSGDMPDKLATGRDYLQGAYIAQKEYNSQQYHRVKVCLLIANMGSNPSYADTVVAQQIVNVAGHFAVKGVMGWPDLMASSQAVSILNQANIPIVSPARYNTLDTALNLFHSIPSNETEGMLDAAYAEQGLHAHTILVSYAPLGDSVSLGLESGFVQQINQDGASDVRVTPIPYASCTGQNATMNCENNLFTPLLEKAIQLHPDLIVFTGNASDGNILLESLARTALPSTPRVLGRNDLYQLADNSVFESPYIQHLSFTSFAYYGEESVKAMMHDYAANFDAGDSLPPERAYGYSKPDDDVIFSYNAMLVLVALIDRLPSPVTPFSPSDVQQALAQEQVSIIGAQQSQTMTFDNLHEAKNVGLVVLQVGTDESIQMIPSTIHS